MPQKGSSRKPEPSVSASDAEKFFKAIAPYRSKRREARFSLKPKHSALIIIDMQEYFLDPESHAFLPGAEKIIPNIRMLADSCRMAGVPVIYTRYAVKRGQSQGLMGRWWNDVVYADEPRAAMIPGLCPTPGDIVIDKPSYSAFAGTGLQDILEKAMVIQLIITGVMTHLCCETTARDAFGRGFETYFIIDGTADENEEMHEGSLRALADGFSIMMTAKEAAACLRK